MKPSTPTEHLIADLAAKSERYRIALSGCLIGARNGLANEDEARASLQYIEKEAEKALNSEEVAE